MIKDTLWFVIAIIWVAMCIIEIATFRKTDMPIRGIVAEGVIAYMCFLEAFGI